MSGVKFDTTGRTISEHLYAQWDLKTAKLRYNAYMFSTGVEQSIDHPYANQ